MTTELTTTNNAAIAERVMVLGDLAQLSPAERVEYYGAVCKSLGLNPLTKPFDYIPLNGKLTLYAKKDATDQLRKINNVSIGKPDIQQVDDLIIVTVVATDATGRTDSDIGVVKRSDMRGDVANATMKAVTKAKRRVTLSICGLGFLDESEVESIPNVAPVIVNDSGVIEQPARITKPSPQVVDVTDQYVTKPAQTSPHAPLSVDDKIAKLIAWADGGGRVNAKNMDWANDTVDEIAAAQKITLNQGDTTQGRMDALVAELRKAQTAAQPA